MSNHNHGHDHHGHDHSHPHSHSHGQAASKGGLAKNWKVWLFIGLMLLGMLIYILTLDESIQPGR